ncbi:MAG: methylmalonyl-CoA mutase family protein [Marinifilaceae bacterium]|jgi:methylmalonyl-CoA mutase|nr:methylmalonyl-CoA mutase family protein [Marinifilaceae bacterium]
MANNKLFSDFAPQTTQEWIDKITKDLKGADFDRKLVWRTNEGFNVQPFYRLENLEGKSNLNVFPGDFPYIRGNKKDNNEWLVRQDIIVDDIKAANAKALDVLNKGVDSLGFILNWKELDKAQLTQLLDGLYLDCVEVNFEKVHNAKEIISFLKEIAAEKSVSLDKINGCVAVDPIGNFSSVGNIVENAFDYVAECINASKELPNLKVISVEAKLFNNAGSSIVEELGFALSSAVQYFTELTEKGMDAEEVASKIKFHFATSSKYFMEIAKLRSARLLWAYILKEFGVKEEACKMYIHAETSDWNKTIYDPYVNMLRTQTEAMSAVLGGLDSFTVNPFNSIYEDTTEFSERIARNQQLLLKEESHFGKIADPAAGSYYIETLTESISEEAWKLFLETEEKGGYVEAFKAGFIQETIEETARKRDMAVANRKENLLGTNQFPNFGEQMEAEIDAKLFAPIDQTMEGATCKSLKAYRGAQAFEELRYKTDQYSKDNGRVKAMMFPIGNLNMRKARAQFACNFFACAGFEVSDHNGFVSVEEGVEYVKSNGAKIVVVCSSDDEYAEYVPAINEALNGEAILVVAGAPACAEELKAKGITNFINVKSNVLETLKAYQKELGI